MAKTITKSALGPLGGPPKLAIRTISRLVNFIGNRRNTTTAPMLQEPTDHPFLRINTSGDQDPWKDMK